MPLKKAQYNALDVAKYIIYLASQNIVDEVKGEKVYEGITNLKLQKLLYFVQVFYLVKKDKPLFVENIQAWQYGPVVYEVYQQYKKFQSNSIVKTKDTSTLSDADKKFIEHIWDSFGKYSTTKLIGITHAHTPWQEAYKTKNQIISNKSLQEYYTPMFSKAT